MSTQPSRLKRYLDAHGTKQKWLAEQSGLSQGWLSKVINERKVPNVYDALKIAKTLGTTVEELWGDDEQ